MKRTDACEEIGGRKLEYDARDHGNAKYEVVLISNKLELHS